AVFLHYVVLQSQARLAAFAKPGSHRQLIVITRAALVAAQRLNHRQRIAAFLKLGVRDTGLAHRFGTADLEEDDVVAVIDHAHLVGLGVAYSDRDVGRHVSGQWPVVSVAACAVRETKNPQPDPDFPTAPFSTWRYGFARDLDA